METRPKIQPTLSPLDKSMELFSKIFLALMLGLTAFLMLRLPGTIPTHFNASGKPDSYGSKMTLLILPALGTAIYFGLSRLNNYPHIFNYTIPITEENAQEQYAAATRMLRFLKLAILVIFTYIILCIYLTITGVVNGLGAWFMPCMLVLLLAPAIFVISKSSAKKKQTRTQ